MFEKGDMVVCGNNGVCKIEKISKLEGMDNDIVYYIMRPVYEKSSTVYIPVESHKTPVRKMMNKDEALAFIKEIPEIGTLTLNNEKQREEQYKACMQNAECKGWVTIIKTLYERNNARLTSGKKIISMDERYMRMAKNCLYGELAVSLDIEKDKVESYIEKILACTEK
ncbi:MAG: CarD family transcriptional regulator [Bacteroides sp.]